MVDFPYPLVTVRGEAALAQWEVLRAGDDGYPVIVGDDDALARLAEGLALDGPFDPAVTLEAASVLSGPSSIHDYRRQQSELYAALLGEEFAEEWVPELGDWPASAPQSPGLTVHLDLLSGQPHERVHIALLPTSQGWEAPAYLRYGGWNECPPPEHHVAMLRSWHERYGAELVGISSDMVNVRAATRPQTRDEALDLAREKYAYCADIVDQGVQNLSALAAGLMADDWWFFWWD